MKRSQARPYLEIIDPVPPSSRRVVLFDFDGTLSLIRRGWQEIMIGYMIEVLGQADPDEDRRNLRNLTEEFVAHLTGKQTIFQMIRLAEEVARRGKEPLDPLLYKRAYHDRLWSRIEERIEALRRGEADPEEWLLPGSRPFLEELAQRGVQLYLASGTDEAFVLEEARLLGIDHFFRGIHGALDEYQRFSKRIIIERVFAEENLTGADFVSFGDGYVEIENTREVGGVAVGVASFEERPSGCDEWKRARLIRAGAQLVIPHFGEYGEILDYLFDGDRRTD